MLIEGIFVLFLLCDGVPDFVIDHDLEPKVQLPDKRQDVLLFPAVNEDLLEVLSVPMLIFGLQLHCLLQEDLLPRLVADIWLKVEELFEVGADILQDLVFVLGVNRLANAIAYKLHIDVFEEFLRILLDVELVPEPGRVVALLVDCLAHPHVLKSHLKPVCAQEQTNFEQNSLRKASLQESRSLFCLF